MDTHKKNIITINGRPGSGKSTTAKGIAKQLGYTHFSAGDLFRAVSKERGHDVLTSNLEAEKEDGISTIDQLVDQHLRELEQQENRFVVDSRMAWHWMPHSFRIFLDLDLSVAALRILKDITPVRLEAENIPNDPDEYATLLENRLGSESRRYKRMYDVDPYDLSNYDLVIDTKTHGIEAVITLAIEQYNNWLNT